MTFVIGVDGGGTRMRAVVVDLDGRELGRAEGHGAVVTQTAPGDAVHAVRRAVRAAADRSAVELPCAALVAGLAGAGQITTVEGVRRRILDIGIAEEVKIVGDVEATFHAAFGDGPGILLIAGTGSNAWGRGSDRRMVRVGGWGQHLGDEGSGFAIGMGALRAVIRAEDGRGPDTRLGRYVLDVLRLSGVRELVPWIEAAPKAAVAALVPIVESAVEAGDEVAAALFSEAVDALELHLTTLLARGSFEEDPHVVLWGGLIAEGGPLRQATLAMLERHPVHLVTTEPDPPVGAARLALDLVGSATG